MVIIGGVLIMLGLPLIIVQSMKDGAPNALQVRLGWTVIGFGVAMILLDVVT